MKKIVIFIAMLFAISSDAQNVFPSSGAVGIGTTTPNSTSILDVRSTSRGVLFPHLTTAQRNAIPSPASGLLLYQTDGTQGFYYYNAGWKAVTPSLTGLANTTLSNLASPTAVRINLTADSNNLRDLGSSSRGWRNLYLGGYIYLDGLRFLNNAGTQNSFVGATAGNAISTGHDNTGAGYRSLFTNSAGSYNTATGSFSLASNTGSNNTANGTSALRSNTSGHDNTATGLNALYINTTQSYNTATGSYALFNNAADANTANGYNALGTNSTGTANTGIGIDALFSNTTSSNNTATGAYSLFTNTGEQNTAVGSYALFTNGAGNGNTSVGYRSLYSNTTAESNTAIGIMALENNQDGADNTALGAQALNTNTSGYHNTATGSGALYGNYSGHENVASGYDALAANSEGAENVGVGVDALNNNLSGNENTAVGTSAIWGAGGDLNVAIGSLSLYEPEGSQNTAVGARAAIVPSSINNCTFLGAFTDGSNNTTNSTAIGYDATFTASNQVRIGNSSVSSIGGFVSWSNISDGRFKKDISEGVPGLQFINKLRPVTYHLDVEGMNKALVANMPEPKNNLNARLQNHLKKEPTDEEKKAVLEKTKIVYTGFVAQEVEKAAREISYDFSGVDKPKSDKEFYGLRYAEFVVPLVKAVQELSVKNEELQNQINELKALLTKNGTGLPVTSIDANGYLKQNFPNPARNNTTIDYYIPADAGRAQLKLMDAKGSTVKIYNVHEGQGQINIKNGELISGTYSYALYVNEKRVDTKQMIIAR